MGHVLKSPPRFLFSPELFLKKCLGQGVTPSLPVGTISQIQLFCDEVIPLLLHHKTFDEMLPKISYLKSTCVADDNDMKYDKENCWK